ncbi:MAG TPA: ABC transporter ATP-binding protein [Phenylobacterium sp.]|jgi:iron complex transport system ATP-binding protein|uniref:ABC transporter ATP-binding protein n=1 Tax=Phenylobacterium sp. TaxID=1871053 RepID=UPI002D3AE712|nr:ABC transporter ATP-binding protein [Phenylobacterium sp.]HZZ66690.1 ABC transporter ATP-binding protein [Phenylobacterium sp.]
MSHLGARNLTVRRGGRAIVDDVSFDVAAGAFVALVGPNGAGKSTLLSLLAGLTRPDSGLTLIDGAPLDRLTRRELARRRAYLPQNPRAEWPIATERLVALGLTPHLPAFGGLPGGMEPRLTQALEACDLAALRLQPATTLSGGELARAMLARALVGDPKLLIADEPISGLDPWHALDTVTRLKALAGEGRLVVAALHDLTLAARFSTHLMALRAGRLAAFGPTGETLTAGLVREVFDVEARIQGSGLTALVDYLGPAGA